jgi:hypothetical protein
MPKCIPHWIQDLEGLMIQHGLADDDLPEQLTTAHHALHDAYHDREIHRFIMQRRTL